MRRRRGLTLGLWLLAGLVLLSLLGNAFLGGVYHVDSGSMKPTLFGPPRGSNGGGEWVLVLYDRAPDVERFDLVVLERAGEREPVVKRVAGMPGERVQLEGGDVLIDGRRLAASVPRPAQILVFDQARHGLEEHFYYTRGEDSPWSRAAGVWRLDGARVAAGSDGGMMLYHPGVADDYLEPDGEVRRGTLPVNDCTLEFEVRFQPPPSVVRKSGAQGGSAASAAPVPSGARPTRYLLRAWLVEAGDTFELLGDLLPSGGARLQLTRRSSSQGAEVLAERELELAPNVWHRIRLENRDNHLRVEVDDARDCLTASYASNVPYRGHAGASGEGSAANRSVGPRAAFGGEGLTADFRGVRVLRDLYYTPAADGTGDAGTADASGAGVRLGPDEYFVLGDNSADSFDSRHFGPVKAQRLLGKPVAVVWPPGRIRILRGAAVPR